MRRWTEEVADIAREIRQERDMRLVKVEWLDSYGCSTDWTPLDEIDDSRQTCTSVGYLAQEGDHTLVIVPHLSQDNPDTGHTASGCGDMAIPRQAVVRVVDLIEEEKPPLRRRGQARNCP